MLSMALQPFSKIATIIDMLVDSVLTREAAKLPNSHDGHNVVSVIIVCVTVFTSCGGRGGRPGLSV